MHGEALTAAIDAWLKEIREECEIAIEKRERTASGETLVIVADDNPWEESGTASQQVSVVPPRDGKIRILFYGRGRDDERGLSYAYFNMQTSLGEFVDVADQHRIHIWIGTVPEDDAIAAIHRRYEDGVIDGVWEHLISVDHLIRGLSPATPLGHNIAALVAGINRRIA